MKICVSSKSDTLDGEIDPRFGRCQFFLIIETDTNQYASIKNDGLTASGGAGIHAAQQVAKTGAKMVLTGNIGPNAHKTLSAAGILIYTGANGTIKETLRQWKQGKLSLASAPNVQSHAGM